MLRDDVYAEMPFRRALYLLIVAFCGMQCFAQSTPTASSDSTLALPRAASWQQSPGEDRQHSGKTASSPDAKPEAEADSRWQFDLHFGYTITPHSTSGTGSIPDVSTPSSTSGDLLQPSFFFGSGAVQASAVSTGNGLPAISPYDSALTSAQAQRKNGFSFGFRLGKDMNRWLGLEYQFEYGFTPLRLTNFAKNQATTTANSIQAGLSPLMALTGGVANAQTFLGSEGGRQMFNTINANIYLRSSDAKWRPYFSLGGGILNNRGEEPSLDLLGTYQVGGSSNVIESDQLNVRYQPRRVAPVAEYGIGVKHFINDTLGLRFDLRDNMAWEDVRTRIFAFPNPSTGGTSTFLFAGNGRSIAFSNDQTVLQSTLARDVNGATTFNATGIKHHVNASVGIMFRF